MALTTYTEDQLAELATTDCGDIICADSACLLAHAETCNTCSANPWHHPPPLGQRCAPCWTSCTTRGSKQRCN